MERSNYDKQLKRWARSHYWDSLEKDKELIMWHLQEMNENIIEHEAPCTYDHDMLKRRGAHYCENCLKDLDEKR